MTGGDEIQQWRERQSLFLKDIVLYLRRVNTSSWKLVKEIQTDHGKEKIFSPKSCRASAAPLYNQWKTKSFTTTKGDNTLLVNFNWKF